MRDTLFFYPAAGSDYADPLEALNGYLNTFLFCDVNYPRRLSMGLIFKDKNSHLFVRRERSGMPNAMMEKRRDSRNREYWFLEPSSLLDVYEQSGDKPLHIIRRRGFGQMALTKEFAPRSIGVFMHRGDSRGEGGSAMFFLSNKIRRFEPIGNLFDKLSARLADKALVITDGSNTSISNLSKFHRQDVKGSVAYEYHRGKDFVFGDFHWSCVGWLSNRYGPTLVWGLRRQTGAHAP